MSSAKTSENDIDEVADKLQLTHIEYDSHWDGFWDAAFGGERE